MNLAESERELGFAVVCYRAVSVSWPPLFAKRRKGAACEQGDSLSRPRHGRVQASFEQVGVLHNCSSGTLVFPLPAIPIYDEAATGFVGDFSAEGPRRADEPSTRRAGPATSRPRDITYRLRALFNGRVSCGSCRAAWE